MARHVISQPAVGTRVKKTTFYRRRVRASRARRFSMREGNCVSCGQGLLIKGSTNFPCPTCDVQVGRCGSCREQAVAYTCPGCGYMGP